MKNLFPGYHKPTEEQLLQMWEACIFAFDANVFLNIYKYTSNTREEFFRVLKHVKDRIWIPHQAAFEYSKNRSNVIESQIRSYDQVASLLDNTYSNLKKQLGVVKRHPSINVEQLLISFQSGIDEAKKSLDADRRSHPDLRSSDLVGDTIESLLEGKVGSAFDTKKLVKIYNEAELRFVAKQPPGYKDAKDKEYPDKYGDVVMWFQLVEYAKSHRMPIIFITDEEQEDWWQIDKAQNLSPKPELINEFKTRAGVAFWMYSSEQFIEHAKHFLKVDVPQAAVQEVASVRQQDRAFRTAIDYLAAQDSITQRYVQNAGAIDNLLLRRATEMSSALQNPLALQAIENFRAFDNSTHRVIRSALEDRMYLDNSLLRTTSEAVKAAQNRPMLQATEVSRLLEQQLALAAKNSRWFSDPLKSSLAEAAFWQRSSLSGWPIHRDMNLEISPKRSSGSAMDQEGQQVQVEVLEPELENSTQEDSTGDVDQLDEKTATQTYEFDINPLTVTVSHRTDSSHPYKTSHRLRRPTIDEWFEWASKIECNRRYYSDAEIEEHNSKQDDEEEKATEIWSPFYSEWEANEGLYNKLLLEIAGIRINQDDKFPRDQFRKLAPELIDKLQFETKSVVITKLYGCYCELENTKSPAYSEERVVQTLSDAAASSFEVIHTLRRPTKDESHSFRTNIVTGYFSKNEDDQEIIELKVSLPSAIKFYDELIVRVENASVGGKPFSEQTRDLFLQTINPVYKLRVLEALFNVNAWYFKFDEIIMP